MKCTLNLPETIDCELLSEPKDNAFTIVLEIEIEANKPSLQILYNWMAETYDLSSKGEGKAIIEYKKNLLLKTETKEWNLIGCWPQKLNFGSLSILNRDVIEIKIRYDKEEK